MEKDEREHLGSFDSQQQGLKGRRRITFTKHMLKLDFDEMFKMNSPGGDSNSNSSDKRREFYKLEDIEDGDEEGIEKLNEPFWHLYEKKNKLGEGTSAVVRRCIEKRTGKTFAVKIVRTRDEEIIFHLKNEFRNLRDLKNEHIIEVYKLLIDHDSGYVYLLMEFFEGVEMFKHIQNIGIYSEEVAKQLALQLFKGIKFLHSHGVVHRDLKPNNLLVSKDNVLKITDFNVAKFFDSQYKDATTLGKHKFKMYTYTGTLAFSAPEIFDSNEYTEMVDMWSAGCVLYTMLCGYQPFYHEYVNELTELIKTGVFQMEKEPWENISVEAKDLIAGLIVVDPDQRQSPEDALSHAWFFETNDLPTNRLTKLSQLVISNLIENELRLTRHHKKLDDEKDHHHDHHQTPPEMDNNFNGFLKRLTHMSHDRRRLSYSPISNLPNLALRSDIGRTFSFRMESPAKPPGKQK
jgi:serine/threonine protein kinase